MTRYSEVSYTYSGGSKVFTIPFSYLKTEHINVFIDDVEATNFEFNTTSQIQINDEITSGQVVKIVRTTPIDSRMVNFNDRSVLNAQQQNLDSNQLFNVVQEVYDRNDNFTVSIQTQVDTANTNASAAISTANTASSKADTAVSTANSAETKADNAVSTANSAISIANIASTNATNAVNTANSASSAATAASNKVDEFGQSIETVVEAASKINQLEQSVTTATNAAITATNKASEANTSATTANQKVTEITNLITDFNNQKGQANGIAPLDANTKLQLIHIPTGVELTANKGVANGYAGLDADGKVPKAQLPKTSSGLELCDIGMALYVDETKGLRRYLNGQIVDINTNTQAFLNRLQQITTLHPSLLCTENEWQTAKTMSAFGQVGKFVFNYSGEEIVSVRIPRVVNVQGLFDLQNLGMTVSAGLPNITGKIDFIRYDSPTKNATGAFASSTELNENRQNFWQGAQNSDVGTLDFNANNSNSIYGNSTTVQQEAIQYPYFIQIATGSETENNIINDIELNNPFSLFDSKYSDHELNNLSWLKSEGQWNAKAVYPDAYDKLLKVHNGTETVEGLSVKLSTETYTDYDFVLNTADETFRLPLLDGSEDLVSDKYKDLEILASGATYTAPANGWLILAKQTNGTNQYVQFNATVADLQSKNMFLVGDEVYNNGSLAYSHMPIKKGQNTKIYYNAGGTVYAFRFIYAQGNGSLYYYVGETVQNANLIDAGRIGEQLANKQDKCIHIIDTYVNGTSGYIIWSNGYCKQWGTTSTIAKGGATQVVSFLKEYPNTNYSLTFGNFSDAFGGAEAEFRCTGYTSSSVTFYNNSGTSTIYKWQVCGYLA